MTWKREELWCYVMLSIKLSIFAIPGAIVFLFNMASNRELLGGIVVEVSMPLHNEGGCNRP